LAFEIDVVKSILDAQLFVLVCDKRLDSTGQVFFTILWRQVLGIPVAAEVDLKQVLSERGMLLKFVICCE
jgi:hypothetical protein